MVTNLQLGLLGIGGLSILGIYGFNRLQEWRYRRQLESQFKMPESDARVGQSAFGDPESRIEPRLGSGVAAPSPAVGPGTGMEPDDLAEDAPEAKPMARRSAGEESTGIDEAICFVGDIRLSAPALPEALAGVMAQAGALGKPVYWVGLNPRSGVWEDLGVQRHAAYERVEVGLQLADRGGAAGEAQLAKFRSIVEAGVAGLGGQATWSDVHEAVSRAVALDEFCAEVDVLIGINVIAANAGTFPGTKIRGLAESAGLKLQPDGAFHYCNDEGVSLFSLGNLESTAFALDNMRTLTTGGMTFLFDVPRVSRGARAFDQMLQVARHMVSALEGVMVDDNRRPLNEVGIERIRGQLAAIYAKMASRGIEAGSQRAMRLFA
ncbi:MAG: cell division protein ZipA C-terminal FtsZ-binding domain-containing protein [Betaproteobacteria bacterium]|nr:cell division protein ZipA C-terminal FtsZ-binding domain-containing protein [Betaproteobacteria bacterium]